MDKKDYIHKLVETRELSTIEECIGFESALEALQGILTIDDIDSLCEAFYDETQDEEVMFGLVHMMEELRGEDYLRRIAICTPNMEAHDWAMTLNKRIINSPEYFEMYIKIIGSLNVFEKKRIIALLEDIKNDNPNRFSEKVMYAYKRINP